MLRTAACVLLCLAVLLGLAGCGAPKHEGPARVSADGTVTHDGSPVEGANVTFIPKDAAGKPASAKTDARGKFVLRTFEPGDGAIPGKYQVIISKTEIQGDVAPDMDEDPEAFGEYMRKSEAGEIEPAKVVEMLPARYQVADSSDLEAEVTEAGPNTFPFNLTDEGAKAEPKDE